MGPAKNDLTFIVHTPTFTFTHTVGCCWASDPLSASTLVMSGAASRAQLFASRVLRVPGAHRPAPSLFFYPGLTSKPWWRAREDLGLAALEAATPAITAEYLALRDGNGALPPSNYEPEGADHGGGLHEGDSEWHWASLIDRGRRQEDMWQRCPQTAAALTALPGLCEGSMPFSFAFFSTMRAQSRIAPHNAPVNLRVRVHLPLLVPEPERCGIRVAGEARVWTPGEALAFDDAFEHEVWNDGDSEVRANASRRPAAMTFRADSRPCHHVCAPFDLSESGAALRPLAPRPAARRDRRDTSHVQDGRGNAGGAQEQAAAGMTAIDKYV